MANPNFIILYVENPQASAKFYEALLGKPPLEASPTFAMFALPSGVMLGLWSRHSCEPAAAATLGGGGEIAFAVANNNEVTALFDSWTGRGLKIAQRPVDLDFGHTFVALDPDGHRLRVFAAAA
jgi:catechol 2,3-dioxygenase-like lactoylglutathione lyase family enzyme